MANFFEKLVNAWHIFVTSLEFIGRDKSLFIIPILLMVSSVALGMGFVFLLLLRAGLGQTAMLANLFVFLLIVYIWTTFLSSAQSWMVYEVAQGKDTTFASGFKRAVKNIADIVAYAFVMLLVRFVISWLRGKGRLGQAAGGLLDTVSGIAGKLVLPAMIVTERSFGQAVVQLRDALRNLPEIAVFELGMRPLVTFTVFIAIGISFAVGIAFNSVLAGIIIALFLFLTIILLNILLNQIYYTLLYLTLIEKKSVPGLRLSR